MQIDISKGFRQYSPESLRDYTYRGLITCGSYDLSDFLEHIFQWMISEAEAERIAEVAGQGGYDESIVRAGMPVRLIEIKY